MAKILLAKGTIPKTIELKIGYPLGILSLASVLRKRGHRVKIVDCRFQPTDLDWFRREVESFSPDLVGISGLTPEAGSIHALARMAKEAKVPAVIAGGPYPSSDPEAALSDPNLDYLILGEGEETVLELVGKLEDGHDIRGVRGIAFRGEGAVAINPPRPPITDLDGLPFPAWDLIDPRKYFRALRSGMVKPGKYASIFTSRGCPFQCIFCHGLFGEKFRARSPLNIWEEIEWLKKDYGIEEFQVDDDCFNFNRKRAGDFCDLVLSKNRPSRFLFPNGLRGDLLDRETLEKLKAIGTYYLALAVETASPRLQELIGKRLDLNKVGEAARECRRLGITTLGFFMIGFPTETREEAMMTIRWAAESKFDLADFFILNPFKGTRVYKNYVQPKSFLQEAYPKLRFDYHKTNLNLSEIRERDLPVLLRRAYRSFYFPRILRIVLGPPGRRLSLWRGLVILASRVWYAILAPGEKPGKQIREEGDARSRPNQ
ncbi:MAG: radical SAM protein [Proteobacteria bacterium]|nr:radical SAM protein [Pseudomonadota bacterium]